MRVLRDRDLHRRSRRKNPLRPPPSPGDSSSEAHPKARRRKRFATDFRDGLLFLGQVSVGAWVLFELLFYLHRIDS